MEKAFDFVLLHTQQLSFIDNSLRVIELSMNVIA